MKELTEADIVILYDQNRKCPKCGCHKFFKKWPEICFFCGKEEGAK